MALSRLFPPFAWLLTAVLLTAPEVRAQATTEERERRRWSLSGDLDWSISNAEDSSLNLTYYGNDVTRLLRVALFFDFHVSERAIVYLNVTSENAASPQLYGAFLRLAPWGGGDKLWVQAGRIPPAFGSFPERGYPIANPLVGYPLMYHHRTTLRPDQLPSNEADLLGQRGHGRAASFQGPGNPFARQGMPMVSLFRWDTGGVAFGKLGPVDYVGGITNGTLSHPEVEDSNEGKQLLGRARLRFSPAWRLGVSAARGPYLDRVVLSGESRLPGGDLEDLHQTVAGMDARFARGHLIVDTEAAWSAWDVPTLGTRLDSFSAYLESRYRVSPGLHVAGRLDRIDFSEIGDAGKPWDYPLSRVEVGAGYSWEPDIVVKLSMQWNRFEGAPELDEDIVALQIAVRF